ncbi:hypothetical protein ACFOPN_17430 [Xanthomonas hyacinthi]
MEAADESNSVENFLMYFGGVYGGMRANVISVCAGLSAAVQVRN